LALSDAYTDISNITTLMGNVNASYKFTDWLEYQFKYGLNYGVGERKAEIQGWIKGTGGTADGAGAAAILNNYLFSQTLTHTLNFNKDLSDDFSLNALVGYEYWKTEYWGNSQSVYGFDYNLTQTNRVANHYYDNMDDGKKANLVTASFRDPIVEIQSYFARAVFNYKGKYSLTGTFRADGSSKFGSDNRYAYFPSVAASWLISDEGFMKGNPVFNTLKLRVGYGQTGNQEFAADAALDVYKYTSNGSITTNHFGNPALKWETVESYNVGLDFSMLGNRLNGVVDYFYKKTKDPIFLSVVAQPTGAGGVQYENLNGAYVRNSGVELGLWGDIIVGKNFNWSANGNITFVKNKFIFPEAGNTPLALTGGLHGQGTTNAFAEAIAHNQPVDVYFLRQFQGYDKDGIGVYSTNPTYSGDPNPNFYLGFSTDVSYKKWSINLGTHGSFGNKLYNNTAMSVLNISNIIGGRNIAAGLVNTSESPANPITTSTRFLESGSYFKLHSATLRYTLGNVGKYFKNWSIYATANNVFVISKYKGFDPEVNVDKALNGIPSLGIDYIGYPTQRTFLFGTSFSL
jgi:iron complex outermembrane receptor protein